MNKDQAKQAFKHRQLQPHCPVCGNASLIQGRRVDINNGQVYAAAYQCTRCQERFIASIE